MCRRQRFHYVQDLWSVPFPSNIYRGWGETAFFVGLALRFCRFQLFWESGSASKRSLSSLTSKIWSLKWKAARLFIHRALRNSFSQMEGHKNDGLLSCKLKFYSLNTWNIDIKSSCTWFSPLCGLPSSWPLFCCCFILGRVPVAGWGLACVWRGGKGVCRCRWKASRSCDSVFV